MGWLKNEVSKVEKIRPSDMVTYFLFLRKDCLYGYIEFYIKSNDGTKIVRFGTGDEVVSFQEDPRNELKDYKNILREVYSNSDDGTYRYHRSPIKTKNWIVHIGGGVVTYFKYGYPLFIKVDDWDKSVLDDVYRISLRYPESIVCEKSGVTGTVRTVVKEGVFEREWCP